MSKPVKVYDFDNTIYDGDSMFDFYLFNLKKQPSLIRYLSFQSFHSALFLCGLEDRTRAKTNFFSYLKGIRDVDARVSEFWNQNYSKLKSWYRETDHSSDVILTASPEFLIKPVAEKLGAAKLIATIMDSKTGAINGQNCYGAEKVARLKLELADHDIDEAYGDRESDMPVLKLARNAFLVTGDKVEQIATKID